VRLEFIFNVWFVIYRFFNLLTSCMRRATSAFFSFLHAWSEPHAQTILMEHFSFIVHPSATHCFFVVEVMPNSPREKREESMTCGSHILVVGIVWRYKG
jgi:hypothetical protein